VLDQVWKIVLICCASTAAATGLHAQDVGAHVDMGIAANEAHDLRTALQHFQAALEQDSSSYEANWRGALTLLDLGEQIPDSLKGNERDSLFSLAQRYATRAVSANSQGADGHFALAASMGRRSLTLGTDARIRQAGVIRREALRAIELNPRHDGAYHILGRWNAEIMRISGISRFFARRFLGAGVFKEASWNQAIAYMQKAVELDSERIYHRLELARIYADRKRPADAETQLQAVESLPAREVMDSAYKREGAELRRRLAKRSGDRSGS
jgi:tetratricopeptide (TPR) repeat protein